MKKLKSAKRVASFYKDCHITAKYFIALYRNYNICLSCYRENYSGEDGTRTHDLLTASQAL